jgi:ribosome-associated heat shock protein Hsp15
MNDAPAGVRLDRWLWAARFYKTRALAVEAIAGGKVQVNGHRAKRAKHLRVGDELRIRKGPFEHQVVVRGLSERRGPAAQAQTLYDETSQSKQARETLVAHLRAVPAPTFREKGRPTKRERRALDKFKRDHHD